MTRICFHDTMTIVTGATGTFLIEPTDKGYALLRCHAPERWIAITAAPVRDILITRAYRLAAGQEA